MYAIPADNLEMTVTASKDILRRVADNLVNSLSGRAHNAALETVTESTSWSA